MSVPIPPATPPALDRILAIQLTVAWAGEGHGEPPQLGWWATALATAEYPLPFYVSREGP